MVFGRVPKNEPKDYTYETTILNQGGGRDSISIGVRLTQKDGTQKHLKVRLLKTELSSHGSSSQESASKKLEDLAKEVLSQLIEGVQDQDLKALNFKKISLKVSSKKEEVASLRSIKMEVKPKGLFQKPEERELIANTPANTLESLAKKVDDFVLIWKGEAPKKSISSPSIPARSDIDSNSSSRGAPHSSPPSIKSWQSASTHQEEASIKGGKDTSVLGGGEEESHTSSDTMNPHLRKDGIPDSIGGRHEDISSLSTSSHFEEEFAPLEDQESDPSFVLPKLGEEAHQKDHPQSLEKRGPPFGDSITSESIAKSFGSSPLPPNKPLNSPIPQGDLTSSNPLFSVSPASGGSHKHYFEENPSLEELYKDFPASQGVLLDPDEKKRAQEKLAKEVQKGTSENIGTFCGRGAEVFSKSDESSPLLEALNPSSNQQVSDGEVDDRIDIYLFKELYRHLKSSDVEDARLKILKKIEGQNDLAEEDKEKLKEIFSKKTPKEDVLVQLESLCQTHLTKKIREDVAANRFYSVRKFVARGGKVFDPLGRETAFSDCLSSIEDLKKLEGLYYLLDYIPDEDQPEALEALKEKLDSSAPSERESQELDLLQIKKRIIDLLTLLRKDGNRDFSAILKPDSVKAKRAGIENSRNSCYMNSLLQCLAHPELKTLFTESLEKKDQKAYQKENSSSRFASSQIVQEYGRDLIYLMEKGQTIPAQRAERFRQALHCSGFAFDGNWYDQEDPTELLAKLLEFLCYDKRQEQGQVTQLPQVEEQVLTTSDSTPIGQAQQFNQMLTTIELSEDLQTGFNAYFRESSTEPFTTDAGDVYEAGDHCKQLKLLNKPKLLMLQASRFNQFLDKRKDKMEVCEELTVPSKVTQQGEELKYRLSRVICHRGQTKDGGHYVCYERQKDGNYTLYDDKTVTSNLQKEMVGEIDTDGYFFIYEKIEEEG